MKSAYSNKIEHYGDRLSTVMQQSFVCKHCGWTGTGSELSKGEYYPESNIADFNCPKCYELVAFVQFPAASNNDFE